MKLILCAVLLLSALIGFGQETIKTENLLELEGIIKEYAILFKRDYTVDIKWNAPEFPRYRSLGDALRRHFNEHPEDFLKIGFNCYKFKSFCSFARPERREADKVYCEIVMKFIQKKLVDPKSQTFWEWAVPDFAGSKYALDFLEYCKPLMPVELSAGRKRGFYHRIKKIKELVAMYKKLASLNKENTKGWKAYLFSLNDKLDGITKIVDQRIEKLRKESFPNGMENVDWDDEKMEAKGEALTKKVEKLENEKYPLDYQKPHKLLEQLPKFANDDQKEINFDFLSLFQLVDEQGGKMEDSMCPIGDDLILICDNNGKLKFFISFCDNRTYLHGLNFYQAIYDEKGHPENIVSVKIIPYSSGLKKFFIKHLVPLTTKTDTPGKLPTILKLDSL